MTVDECLDKLRDGRPTISGLTSVVRPSLEALVRTETVRCVAICRANQYWNGRDLANEIEKRDNYILRTAPGQEHGRDTAPATRKE